MDALYTLQQEISKILEDFRIQILKNQILRQQEWDELMEKRNKRNQTLENLAPPSKSVWKPPDLFAKPSLKESLLREEEEFPELPKSRQTAFNCIEKPKKKDSTDKRKYDEKSEVPENRISQVHISDVGIGGVFCEAGNNKNEKEVTIVEKMDSGDVTDFHAITEMRNDMVKKENSSCAMSDSLLEADAVEVIIQTPTSLEQLEIKCCFDYSKLSNIYLDDAIDMEQKSVETMIENEHCSTAPNLIVIEMLKFDGYEELSQVFDPGGFEIDNQKLSNVAVLSLHSNLNRGIYEEEHEVYGGDKPDEGEMEADADMEMPTAEDDPAAKELDKMKKRLKEIEHKAAALREMHAKVDKEMGAVQGPATAAAQANREEVDSRFVFVGNVDYACTPEEVQQHFQSCRTVNGVTILTDKFGQPEDFAFVEIVGQEAIQKAIQLTESELHGRKLKVKVPSICMLATCSSVVHTELLYCVKELNSLYLSSDDGWYLVKTKFLSFTLSCLLRLFLDVANRLLNECFEARRSSEALKLVDEMRGRIEKDIEEVRKMEEMWYSPDCIAYNTVISGFCKAGDTTETFTMMNQMCMIRLKIDTVNNILPHSYLDRGLKDTYGLLNFENKKRCKDAVSCVTIIVGYFQEERTMKAWDDVKNTEIIPRHIMLNSMSGGLCKLGKNVLAIAKMNELVENVLVLDEITYITNILEYCWERNVGKTSQFHNKMMKQSFNSDIYSCNIILQHLWCRERVLDIAIKFSQALVSKGKNHDVVTYNTSTAVLPKEARLEVVLGPLTKMEGKELGPDIYIFNALFFVLHHTGKTKGGEEFLSKVVEEKESSSPYLHHVVDGFVNELDTSWKNNDEPEIAISVFGYPNRAEKVVVTNLEFKAKPYYLMHQFVNWDKDTITRVFYSRTLGVNLEKVIQRGVESIILIEGNDIDNLVKDVEYSEAEIEVHEDDKSSKRPVRNYLRRKVTVGRALGDNKGDNNGAVQKKASVKPTYVEVIEINLAAEKENLLNFEKCAVKSSKKLSKCYNMVDTGLADVGRPMLPSDGVEMVALETSLQGTKVAKTILYTQSIISTIKIVAVALFPTSPYSLEGLYIPPDHQKNTCSTIGFMRASFCSTHDAVGLNYCINEHYVVLETMARVEIKKYATKDEGSWSSNHFLIIDHWGQVSKNGRGNVTILIYSSRILHG